ncbi:MAG TPA: tetratricopeptide repeat protein [Candidatus Binatia bacterium]|nr:tetratricopeptide repeat protein [Candidatus Binatia bacterium]
MTPPASARTQPPKRQGAIRSPLRSAALALAVLAAAVLPYLRTLDFDFVWDDHYTVGTHLSIHGWSDVARLWKLPFDSLLNDVSLRRTYFRPATLYSLAADWAASPGDPRAFHRTNVILYAAACLFLWLFASELSGRPVAAAAGAVIYALHPTHPESVAFISGRTDLLGGLFLFAAFWAAVRFGPAIRGPWWKLAPAALLLLPSLFAKEIGLFAAPLIPVALWVRDRKMRWGDAARAAVPVAAAAAIYLACRFAVLPATPLPSIAPVEGTVPQLLTSVAVVARYLPLLLAPVALSARHEIVETHAPDLVFLAGIAVLAGIAWGIVRAARRRSPWLIPLALYAATLLPLCYVRLLSGAIVAERFLFVPSAGLALAVALLPGVLPERGAQRGYLAACGAVSLAFLVLLLPRVALWRTDGTLFLSMLRDSPESPHVHAILGGYYYGKRDLPRAIYHYRRAYVLHPSTPDLLLNLGAAEDEMGQSDSAFAHIRLLNRVAPNYGPGLYALGNLYVRIDRPDSAAAAYRASLQRMPNFPQAENNLGAVLERQGKLDEALEHYRRAMALDASYPDARNNFTRLTAERAGRK